MKATGTNYTAGGQALDSAAISLSGSTALVDFADEVFTNLTISAAGAIIYNSSASNKAIAVLVLAAQLHLHQVTLQLFFQLQTLQTLLSA